MLSEIQCSRCKNIFKFEMQKECPNCGMGVQGFREIRDLPKDSESSTVISETIIRSFDECPKCLIQYFAGELYCPKCGSGILKKEISVSSVPNDHSNQIHKAYGAKDLGLKNTQKKGRTGLVKTIITVIITLVIVGSIGSYYSNKSSLLTSLTTPSPMTTEQIILAQPARNFIQVNDAYNILYFQFNFTIKGSTTLAEFARNFASRADSVIFKSSGRYASSSEFQDGFAPGQIFYNVFNIQSSTTIFTDQAASEAFMNECIAAFTLIAQSHGLS